MRWLMRVLKSPPVWIGTGLLVVTAFILHQIPHATEVTLHVTTENLAFVLPGTASMQPLLQGLPLTSLTLHGLASLVLEVKDLQQQGHSLSYPWKTPHPACTASCLLVHVAGVAGQRIAPDAG